MCPKLLLPALPAVLLFSPSCVLDLPGNFGHYTRDFHFSYPMSSRGALSLETYNGSVEISGWDQDTIDISGTKYGPTQEAADDLKIAIDRQPSLVAIRVDRPMEGRNRGAKFVIKIPSGARVDRITASNGGIRIAEADGPARLKTSNGAIRVQNLKGELNAQTSNGPVELFDIQGEVVARTSNGHVRVERLTGVLEASTSNAAIHAQILRSDRTVRAETSNGPIELTLPPDFSEGVHANTSNSAITLHLPSEINANVSARTNNSSISTDFDVRMQGQFDKNHLNATIGSGGPLFELITSNGPIRLLKM